LKSDERKDRELARAFQQLSAGEGDEQAPIEQTVDMLKCTIFYLMLQIEKLYMHIVRNSALVHDSELMRDMAKTILQFEEVMANYFSEYLDMQELEEQEEENDGGEHRSED
jgi:hypothetical protein